MIYMCGCMCHVTVHNMYVHVHCLLYIVAVSRVGILFGCITFQKKCFQKHSRKMLTHHMERREVTRSAYSTEEDENVARHKQFHFISP